MTGDDIVALILFGISTFVVLVVMAAIAGAAVLSLLAWLEKWSER